MFVELGVVERHYPAVLEVLNDGATVTDVALCCPRSPECWGLYKLDVSANRHAASRVGIRLVTPLFAPVPMRSRQSNQTRLRCPVLRRPWHGRHRSEAGVPHCDTRTCELMPRSFDVSG